MAFRDTTSRPSATPAGTKCRFFGGGAPARPFAVPCPYSFLNTGGEGVGSSSGSPLAVFH